MPGRRLDLREREVIERSVRVGMSPAQISVVLGRSRTTISREIGRNGMKYFDAGPPRRSGTGRAWGRPRVYRAWRAQAHATRRARRPKPCKVTGRLAVAVGELLVLDWSPQQIAKVLPRLYPDDDGMRVSHETIYTSLFVQTRGELRRELSEHLRSKRSRRKPRTGVRRRGLVGIVAIAQRPPEVADRAVPGHWEGDLVLGGTGKGAVITLVERKSRFLLIAPLPGRHTALDLQAELIPLITSLPKALRTSLTWDRGTEMSEHAKIATAADIKIYFCDPRSPWQRGSNENTNGLLRQYWLKGHDMRHLSHADTQHVANLLNTRPRMTLNWKTPAQALDEALSATTD